MIDTHCHIVPHVDDGPSTLEETEKMLDLMNRDGVRGVIATSHKNHPLEFKATSDYETSLERVRDVAKRKYPEIEIYSGAELYVRDGYLDILDSKPYDFSLNGTRYVLIEFEADADYEEISNAVYEFKLRNYIPVLAHIDKYQSLYQDMEKVKKIREEGAYVQITGATLVGKYGKTIQKKMVKLLKAGFVDFIGTDGHSPEKRRPLLKRAYSAVEKHCSRALADKLLIHNPALLLNDETIELEPVKKPVLGVFYSFKPLHIGTAILFLISIAMVLLTSR